MLAGARRYYNRIGRDVTMLALAGDGGTADVGFQSLSGAAERGEQMIYICVDNEGYMNTGVQRSSTTPFGRLDFNNACRGEFAWKDQRFKVPAGYYVDAQL